MRSWPSFPQAPKAGRDEVRPVQSPSPQRSSGRHDRTPQPPSDRVVLGDGKLSCGHWPTTSSTSRMGIRRRVLSSIRVASSVADRQTGTDRSIPWFRSVEFSSSRAANPSPLSASTLPGAARPARSCARSGVARSSTSPSRSCLRPARRRSPPRLRNRDRADLQLCSQSEIRIIPWGGGTSVTGAVNVLPGQNPALSL